MYNFLLWCQKYVSETIQVCGVVLSSFLLLASMRTCTRIYQETYSLYWAYARWWHLKSKKILKCLIMID
uniref:Uncharacterized protein n=1 Tax=Ciona intestinalis TaxID=7719 RepID=H2XUA0_CIOIN